MSGDEIREAVLAAVRDVDRQWCDNIASCTDGDVAPAVEATIAQLRAEVERMRPVLEAAQARTRDLLGERTHLNSRVQSLLERLHDKASNDHVSGACDFADLLARERLDHDQTRAELERTRYALDAAVRGQHRRIADCCQDQRAAVDVYNQTSQSASSDHQTGNNHTYLSTDRGETGPPHCKHCPAPCICICHSLRPIDRSVTE